MVCVMESWLKVAKPAESKEYGGRSHVFDPQWYFCLTFKYADIRIDQDVLST